MLQITGLENSNAVTVPPATSFYARILHTDEQPSSRNPNLVDANQAGCAYINPSLPTARLIALSLSPSKHNHPSAHPRPHFSYTNQPNSTKKPNAFNSTSKMPPKAAEKKPTTAGKAPAGKAPEKKVRPDFIPSLNLYCLLKTKYFFHFFDFEIRFFFYLSQTQFEMDL